MAFLIVLGNLVGATHPAFASGSGAYLYAHMATSANTVGDYTLIDNPVSNNNPNAMVFVTASRNPGGTYTGFDNHQVGVWYNAWAGKWGIFNEDATNMPIGASFNVYVLPGASPNTAFVQTATLSNTSGYLTHMYSGYFTDVSAVWYNTSANKWCIFDGSFNAMPTGASFFVTSTTKYP